MEQLAPARHDAVVGGTDVHQGADGDVGKIAGSVRHWRRRRVRRHLQRLGAGHGLALVGPERPHPLEPGLGRGVAGQHRRHRRPGVDEPQDVVGREVGDRPVRAKQVGAAVGELGFQIGQERLVSGEGLRERDLADGGALAEGGPVSGKRGGRLRVGQEAGHVLRLEADGHASPEQLGVHPPGQGLGGEAAGRGIQGRSRSLVVQPGGDRGGVAVDVGAHLQHRRAPVAAGERDGVRPRHDHRDDHGAPGNPLGVQHRPRLLGK